MMDESRDGPPLIRPIPRRAFNHNARPSTPPQEEDLPAPRPPPPPQNIALNLESLHSRLLSVSDARAGQSESTSISRDDSFRNLTSSTLMGIYGPGGSFKDDPTPWGTGAESPTYNASQGESLHYQSQKDEAPKGITMATRRKSSAYSASSQPRPQPLSTSNYFFQLGLRSLLLATLGVVYGFLVAQAPGGQRWASLYSEGIIASYEYDLTHMAFWAFVGVGLGMLLPWFDSVWASVAGDENAEAVAEDDADAAEQGSALGEDWTLAIRGVGAFVGIAFAIRKVPWDSAMQASVTLALVNPMLWFLIDRSTPGFVLSAGVGLAGSLVLTGLQPDVALARTEQTLGFAHVTQRNATPSWDGGNTLLGGAVHRQTMEMGIWVLSVLFCCCVCFGNVGRRLALTRSAISRGLWSSPSQG